MTYTISAIIQGSYVEKQAKTLNQARNVARYLLQLGARIADIYKDGFLLECQCP